MWSDRYNYYNIQFDEKFSIFIPRETVISSLLALNQFKQFTHQKFTNAENCPWDDIIIV